MAQKFSDAELRSSIRTKLNSNADEIDANTGDITKLETAGIQVYYVGKHGSDTNTGKTNSEAFLTFGKAITEAGTPTQGTPIAIMCFDAGVYTESLTLKAYTSLWSKNITLVGNHTIEGNCVMHVGILSASSGQLIEQDANGSGGVYFGLCILTGSANGFLALNGSELQATGDTMSIVNGYGFGGLSTGSTHINVNNIVISGTGIGVGAASTGQLTANIGCIECTGSGTGLYTASTGIINAIISRLNCNTVYNSTAAGSYINLICANLSGSEIVTGTVNLSITNRNITKEPTGFTNPEDVIINYDSTTRKVTLTGTVNAYYKGTPVTSLTSGWVSDAHGSTLDKLYFLTYDGSSFSWVDLSTTALDFSVIQIVYVYYGTSDKFASKETHGLMQWQGHEQEHDTTGTYKKSGGVVGDYILSSTTTADRRPSVTESIIKDEDLKTTVLSLNAEGSYTQFYLSGADGTVNFDTTTTDIVPLSGNNPYWNELTGGTWQQTLLANTEHLNIWVLQIPVTSDTESQKYRTVFLQGQQVFSTLSGALLENVNEYDFGQLSSSVPEFVVIAKITIKYLGGNWTIQSVAEIIGSRFTQIN